MLYDILPSLVIPDAVEAGMVEAWVTVTLLGVISACLVVMAITAVVFARDLRHTLGSVNRLVSRCDSVAKDARQVLGGARRVVARADRATQQVERLVHGACTTAEETIERLTSLKERAESFVTKLTTWFGNGARSESRLRNRR